MTNFEKYKDELIKILEQGRGFALTDEGVKACTYTLCKNCKFYGDCKNRPMIWLLAEYEEPIVEPTVDWSKVPVDATIPVYQIEYNIRDKRYFAKYEDGKYIFGTMEE